MRFALISAALMISLSCLAQDASAPQPPVSLIMKSPSEALSLIKNPAKFNVDTTTIDHDGVVLYELHVRSTGSVFNVRRVSTDSSLTAVSDPIVKTWTFLPGDTQAQTPPSDWWSVIGVCYSKAANIAFPCAVQEKPELKEIIASPQFVEFRGNAEADTYEVAPLKLINKETLVRNGMTREARISGKVLITLLVKADGKVDSTKVVYGHPMLVSHATYLLLKTTFEPFSFMGSPVETRLKLEVFFSDAD